MSQRKAVILLSGGLDSATVLAMATAQGYACYALSFAYGQRHNVELRFAKALAQEYSVIEHRIAELDLRLFGYSALTDDIAVPKEAHVENIPTDIPVTYVPARNTIFLSFALAYAEVIEAYDIFIGVNAVDYSGYPDCRPAFIEAFEAMANLATAYATQGGQRITIHTPLIHLSKADIIRQGIALGVEYDKTLSCYDPSPEGVACGACHACLLRAKGFAEAQISTV
jgi:7-cyano-7-deazaguanine synthase